MTVVNTTESRLAGRSVATVMRRGVVTASPEQSPRAVAAVMAAHGVHAVVGEDGERTVMTDLDVIAAALEQRRTMRLRSGEPLPMVRVSDDLSDAAASMADAGVTHAVVVAETQVMLGVLSAFDIAAIAAGTDPHVARLPRPTPARPMPSTGHLERLTVGAVMHPGIVALGPGASIRDIAAALAEWRIHAVAITGIESRDGGGGEHLVWAFASAADVLGAVVHGDLARHASEAAATEPLTVDSAERLDVAAARMVEHDVTHAIVVGPTGLPEGVLSSLDLLRVLAIGALEEEES